jgi:hypothetical protein
VELRVAFEEGSKDIFDVRVTLTAELLSIGLGFPDAHAHHYLSSQIYERRNASSLRFDDAKSGAFNDPYEL